MMKPNIELHVGYIPLQVSEALNKISIENEKIKHICQYMTDNSTGLSHLKLIDFILSHRLTSSFFKEEVKR